MAEYIQTGLGIIVSVFLFIVGYRQTIGARKERIKAANEKLIETILRRVILENYRPNKEDVRKLIEGKARDYKVKHNDLLSVDQILNTLYTRIFENDLISQQQREENIERLTALFINNNKEVHQETELSVYPAEVKTKNIPDCLFILLAIISIIIGVSLFSMHKILNLETYFNYKFFITILGSLIGIIVSYLFILIKDNQESSEEIELPKNPFRDYVKFEKEVVIQLKKLNIETSFPNNKYDGYDLIIKVNGEKSAIEIKYWKQRPPLAHIRQTVSRLKSAMDKEGITKGFIIANDTFGISDKFKIDDNIYILSLSDLKNQFK